MSYKYKCWICGHVLKQLEGDWGSAPDMFGRLRPIRRFTCPNAGTPEHKAAYAKKMPVRRKAKKAQVTLRPWIGRRVE
jgi:rubredoxin